MAGRIGQTLVEHHHDVAAQRELDIDGRFGREEVLITIEEGARGGFGAFVLHNLAETGALDRGLRVRVLALPDIFQDHDSPEKQYDAAGLNAPQIVETVLKALRHNSAGLAADARA